MLFIKNAETDFFQLVPSKEKTTHFDIYDRKKHTSEVAEIKMILFLGFLGFYQISTKLGHATPAGTQRKNDVVSMCIYYKAGINVRILL